MRTSSPRRRKFANPIEAYTLLAVCSFSFGFVGFLIAIWVAW